MIAKIASILSTLNETNGSPESMLYIFFDMDMDLWSRVRAVLIESELITIKGNYVTLTEKGRETAIKIDKAVAKNSR